MLAARIDSPAPGIVGEFAVGGSNWRAQFDRSVNGFAGSLKLRIERLNRLARGLCPRQRQLAIPNRICLRAFHGDIRIEDSRDGNLHSRGMGEIRDR